MTKRRSTKSALLSSVLAMFLCFAMLLGTTFAWFTDSVESGKNQIIAGNLDVAFECWDGAKWTDVQGSDSILSDALWEPGYTEVAYLRIKNVGTLALKYALRVNVLSETMGTNVKDQSFKLSDYIYFDIDDEITVGANDDPTYPTREDADQKKTETTKISAGYTDAANLKAGSDYVYLAMIVYMPTTVGNDANYKTGTKAPTIELGVDLFATQMMDESDSFGKDYDADTAVFSVADANAMLAANKDVTLVNCIDPNGILSVPVNYTGTLVLDNVTIASIQESAVATVADESTVTATEKKIVIVGDVAVIATEDGMSAITGTALNISGKGTLTAIANGHAAFGIGGMTTQSITVKGVTINRVEGGEAGKVGSDTKYYKDAPEGGAAIGSGLNGADITLDGVTVINAIGGSKSAGIGARYHVGVNVTIKNSKIAYVEGGVSAAAIGGSRVSNGATENGTTITIENSTITAKGGAYGAGIGSGYDTHCQAKQPLCTINITDSTINATGGKYAAGVGTGYHNAALAGEIKNSTVNAVSGEKSYKTSYTAAMDIGFGVTDPAREGQQTDSKLVYNGVTISIKDAPFSVQSAEDLANALKDPSKTVVLFDDIKTEAATTAPYGNKYAFKLDGGTLDGNGNELYMECYGDDYGIMTSGGTVKNLTITEGCRAIMIMYPQTDIVIDNVNIGGDGVLYPINTGEGGAEGVNLIVTNSTLAGWTSYGLIESASFTNVKFEQGTYYNNIYGRVLKPYVNTTLTDCSFVEHMNLDLSSLGNGQKITMTNCTVNGVPVTKDVFTVPSTDAEYDTALFTVDLPSWATSISDCVIFN